MPPGSPPPAPPPVRLIVAAGQEAPSAAALLAEAISAAAQGASVSVLFSEGGLEFLASEWPRMLEGAGVRMSLCSRSARGRRVEPATLPTTVLWSSLTNFLLDTDPDARLWTVFA